MNPAIFMCSTNTMLKQDAFSSLLLCLPAKHLTRCLFCLEIGKLLWKFYEFMPESKYSPTLKRPKPSLENLCSFSLHNHKTCT